MYEITKADLAAILPNNKHIDEWKAALDKILPKYEINTKLRVAAFIAQCSHESGQFTVLHENLNYRAETLVKVFPKYFPTLAVAKQYAKQPEKIANKVYGGRMGNGPEATGEGFKFCGRGLIQLTGKANYCSMAKDLGVDTDHLCEYLCSFEGALESACWFWDKHDLNTHADKKDILTITKKINGGTNGLEERNANYALALKHLP
jgi:putative chitinase